MRRRGFIRAGGAAAMVAAILSSAANGPAPVAAHSGYTSIGDDANADQTVTNINGTTMTVRILRPSTAAPAAGWPLVVYMAGDLKNRCANVNEVISLSTGATIRPSWYTRKQMAENGFAVLSFNARGAPANYEAGINPSGTSGCTAGGDAIDMTEKNAGVAEDTGWDLGGPNDKGDIKGLIDWAVNNYSPSGCATPGGACINGDQVGLFGYGFDKGLTALLMGVPNPPNAQYSSRVKGIVAVGYEEWTVRNVKDVSNDGAGTPAWRDIDHGLQEWVADAGIGSMSYADLSVYDHTSELLAAKYLNTSVPSATTTWLDDRTVVDDDATTADGDPRVDKAGLITTPVFLANAFLDASAATTTATLAYNKLASANKYLYLGACGSGYSQLGSTESGPCLTTNAANLRDKVHAFLDRWVKQDTTASVGGPVFWAVPPATNPLSTDSWGVATDAVAAWPPSTNALDAYTVEYCLDGAGEWHTGLCSTVPNGTGADLQDTNDRTVSNVLGTTDTPFAAWCSGANYGANEVVSYTSETDTVDYKMIGFELDVSMKSDTTRLQVYGDLFTVDADGNETRVWQGSAQAVPVKRNGTAGTVYRFKFKPAGAAWTLKAGHSVRVKIAANYKSGFAQELLPATYTIKHTDTNPLTLKITFDL